MGLFTSGWGRLGRDIEINYNQSGFAFGKVGVGCKIPKKNQDGTYGTTEWVELTFLGKAAENAASMLQTGSKVWFTGYPETSEWDDKNNPGVKRKQTRIIVQQWEALDANPNAGQQGGQQGGFQPQGQQGGFQPQGQQPQGQQFPQQPGGFNPNQPGQPQQQQPQPQPPQQQGPGQGFGQNPPPQQGFGQQQPGPGFQQPGPQPPTNTGTGDDVPF